MIISYAIAHNVQNLSIDTIIPKCCRIPLSIFSHRSLKKLRILDVFRKSPQQEEGLCWCLPALTVLHISGCNLPDSFLNLPALTTLCLGSCTLPISFSSLPGLTTLHLKHVRIYENKSRYFSELVNLKNLTLEECQVELKVINVSSLQLTNLTIYNSRESYKFVISAPKLLAFNHSGTLTEYVFPLTSTSLHKVNLEMIRWYFYNWEEYEVAARLIALLQELQNAKFLTINMVIIEALSKVPDLLDQHSPLKNLKFLKVKEDHKFLCSTIPSHVRTYLLSGSPSATIVKEFPKANESLAFAIVPTGVQIECLDKDEPQGTPSEPLPVVGNLITNVDAVILPCAQTQGRGKSLMSDSKPLLIQNVEYEGGVRKSVENKFMACAGSRSDHEHIQQTSRSLALDKVEGPAKVVEGAGKEVKEKVVVNDAVEQFGAQDRHIEVGVDEETINVEDMVVARGEKDHVRQNAGLEDNAVQQKERMEKVTETIPDQENVVCNMRVIGDALHGIRGLVPRALVDGGDDDQTGFSRVNDGFALWQGHVVDLEFVDLLELIREKYPETFEHFTPQSEIFYTMGLNMLCTSVNAFSKVSTTEVTSVTITKYRALFADLKGWGFNITWLVNRLNWVEELRFSRPLFDELHVIDSRIEVSRRELQELQNLRVAKMAEIQEAFGQLGSKLVSGNLGDGLFPDYLQEMASKHLAAQLS